MSSMLNMKRWESKHTIRPQLDPTMQNAPQGTVDNGPHMFEELGHMIQLVPLDLDQAIYKPGTWWW
jgi:hypothetical protein